MDAADNAQRKKALLFLLRSVSGKAELLVDDEGRRYTHLWIYF
jgi:hypothetical protein